MCLTTGVWDGLRGDVARAQQLRPDGNRPHTQVKSHPAHWSRLKPGGTIVEATAGNTGLGLALVGGRKGYRTVLVVPDRWRERRSSTPGPWEPRWCSRVPTWAKAIPTITRTSPRGWRGERPAQSTLTSSRTRQSSAHETGTGPELIAQMEGDIDAVVVGIGSGGTLTGVGRYMKSRSPKTDTILAGPAGSVLAPAAKPSAARARPRADACVRRHDLGRA
jgi:cystathionine beta-synthase